jgi:hypothetical protein
MTLLINTLKAALIPQPKVRDRHTIERVTFWRSIFMQGELGAAGEPDWKVEAEVQSMKGQLQ